jgi:hypothetical protein
MAYALPTSAPHTADSVSSSSLGLLATPTASDRNGTGMHGNGGMGSRKTVAEWDEWTLAMRQRHGNGNGHGHGHGQSLAIEALRMLPTPTAMDSRSSGGSNPSNVTLTDAVVRTSLGAHTNPRFDDGNTSSTGQLPLPLNET